MTRTDIHRPAELVTEDYSYQFARDLQAPTVGITGEPLPIHDQLRRLFADHDYWIGHSSGHCDHCGAAIRYAAYLVHKPTGDVITVGETCLDNRFERTTAEFQALRKAAELDRQQQRLVKAERQWVRLHLDMAWLLDLEDDDHYILHDMRRKLRKYGSLSERQIAFAKRLLSERLDREEAAKNAPVETKVRIPDQYIGRVPFEGTILGTKWVDGDYGSQFKAMIRIDLEGGEFFTLWGTVPMAQKTTEKGETIKWVARIDRSRNDDTHGYFSRPRLA